MSKYYCINCSIFVHYMILTRKKLLSLITYLDIDQKHDLAYVDIVREIS